MPGDAAALRTPAGVAGRLRHWLFQTDRPTSPQVELRQRQIFIVPSRAGLLFGLVLTVMYLGAVNYSLGLGHALVFLLAALGLTTMVHSFRNLVGLQLGAGRATAVHVGDIARFELFVENHRHEHRPALQLQFKGQTAAICELPPDASTHAPVPCLATQRGWFVPPRLTLSTRYPLGLFYAWSYPSLALRCLVYPAPIYRPLPPLSPGDRPGSLGNESGDDDFAGFNYRQPGDPPKHVAWKRYARDPIDRPLLIKRFSGAAEPELRLDWKEVDAVIDDETRLSILTGWVVQAHEQNLRFALQLPQRRIAAARGEAHAAQCLEALALHGQG